MFMQMQDVHLPLRLLQLCALAALALFFWPGLWIPLWLLTAITVEVAGYSWGRRHLGLGGSEAETKSSMQVNDLLGHIILILWVVPAFFISGTGGIEGRYFAMLLLGGIAMAVSWQHGRLGHSALINAAIPGISMLVVAAAYQPFDILLLVAAILFGANAFILTLAAQKSDDAMFRAQSAHEELIAELEVAREQAEQKQAEAERHALERADLLSLMSHEVRTPLNGIIALSEKLTSGLADGEQRRHASAVAESGRMLLRIVNDVLDQSRIDAGHMALHLEWMSRDDLVRDGLAPWRARAEAEGIALAIAVAPEVPARFLADPRRLIQILQNLLGNAFKFAGNGPIRLSIARLGGSGSARLEFAVADSGPGIAPEDHERIFQRFERVETKGGMTTEGTGLGLPIAREFAKLMGGDITLESEPGAGTTFRFHFPLREGEPASSPPSPPVDQASAAGRRVISGKQRRSSGPLQILVADDNEINLSVIEAVLSGLDPVFHRASDGRKAIAAFKAHAHELDIILMDVRMPHLDGHEAIREIRQLEGGDRIPIIALTANADPDDETAAYDAGADAWLPKPIDARSLITCVTELSGLGSNKTPARDSIARAV